MDRLQHVSVFISTQTTALLLGKTVRTIQNWIEAGTIQGKTLGAAHLPGGRRWQINLFDIEHHICIPLSPELVDWIQQADTGDAAALKKVGIAFAVENYNTIAVQWIEAAAKKGDVDAMDLLSWHYLNGAGVTLDHSIAMQWMAKAAEHGLPTAKIKLQNLGFDVGSIHLNDGSSISPT
ncbi:sel1 repeat family protein [Acidithiobacillus thiooxidans]|uniref:tetratricopeptide repeat protein n=1 Tax=Acidithiobacillus TaxID=119977 RepID=UPI001C07BD71|nr:MULTISPECIES: tetratricopeptide repeat protein [Acidithiobacillus]MBU2740869.1 sel1 repeat family protein [Acidithiobacillus albertensis]MBU2839489.1 sel1 repeat family protein [Acidithiobacillus thiooxidans]